MTGCFVAWDELEEWTRGESRSGYSRCWSTMATTRSWSFKNARHAISGRLLVVEQYRSAPLMAFVDDVGQDVGEIGSVKQRPTPSSIYCARSSQINRRCGECHRRPISPPNGRMLVLIIGLQATSPDR